MLTDYEWWENTTDLIHTAHQDSLGQDRVTVIEANPLTHEVISRYLPTRNLAAQYVTAMQYAGDDDDGSHWFIVGSDLV